MEEQQPAPPRYGQIMPDSSVDGPVPNTSTGQSVIEMSSVHARETQDIQVTQEAQQPSNEAANFVGAEQVRQNGDVKSDVSLSKPHL
jgi:hypothetical protein